MKKMSNSGFSLVELIVVVLIMAIVAVALAPQVMKWVENSRISSDLKMLGDLEENCKLAIADEEAFGAVKDGNYELKIIKDNSQTPVIQYKYLPTGIDFDTDPFWQSFLKTCGYSDKAEFEENVTVKSSQISSSPVVLHVYVYIGGYTIGKLEGLNNEELGVTSSALDVPDSN